MIENHPQESLLIRFADGHATAVESDEVKVLVQRDPAAAEFLRQLQSTQEWLGHAAQLPLDNAPDNVTALVQGFDQNPASAPANRKVNRLALAATLLAGLTGGMLLGTSLDSKSPSEALQTADASPPEWVRLVADYHALYARETIIGAPAQQRDVVSAELSERLDRKILVPALHGEGLEFKRVQTLEFDNQALLQLAYLPESDRPVAICILAASDMGSAQIISGIHGKMKYAYWQNKQHAVVVVGEIPSSQLDEVVEEVRQTLFPLT